MALESSQPFHQQPNVTQRLCLTVDSSSLAENTLLRSGQAAVSPTFSIADILASSFPETTVESRRQTDRKNETFTALQDCGESGICVDLSSTLNDTPDRETNRVVDSTANPLGKMSFKYTESIGIYNENEQSSALSVSSDSYKTTHNMDVIPSKQNFREWIESAEDIRNDWIGDQEITISDPGTVNNESKPELEVVPLPNEVSKSSNTNMAMRLASLTRSPIFQLDLAPDREGGSMNAENEGEPEKSARGSEISVSTGQDSFNDKLDYLLDAARCIRAETQLQEAETVVDALIAKFAEPLDLYTAWENLHRSSPIPMTYSQKGLNSSVINETKSPTFSPILSLLMAQSEVNIFPQLCQPSSTGKKLLELCSQLAGDIRRLKRKLRILHKARARRSSNSGCGRPNTAANKPLVCDTNTVSSTERRSVYLRRLQEIWPNDGTTSDSCELTQPVLTTTDPPGVSPCVYTSPMECPLSLLSFVSESLNNIHSQSTTMKVSNPVEDAASTRTETFPTSSEQRASERQDLLVSSTSELTVQVHSADLELRSPTTLSGCPSLSDTHPSFPGVESPQPPTFSHFSPSLSPSSCSTASIGPVGARIPASGRDNSKSTNSSRSRGVKPKDTVSCCSSSSSSRSSSANQKRLRGRGRGSGARQLTGKTTLPRKRETNTNRHCISASSPSKSTASEADVANDHSTISTLRDHVPKRRRPRPITLMSSHLPGTWTQLRVSVRDPEVISLPDGITTAPDLNSPSSPIPSSLIAPCSAPCVSFHPVESTHSSKHNKMDQIKRDPLQSSTQQQQQKKQRDRDSNNIGSLGSPSSLYGWATQEDHTNQGLPTRPPTPDIRRSDLDLADLSNGTRVLVIQDTHLRAGTLYLGSSSVTNPITLPTSSLRDQLFRIQLDSERPSVHPGSPRFTSLPSPSRVNSVPGRRTSSPAWTASAGLGSFNYTMGLSLTGGTSKKRRQSDLILYGWQVVQQAVLEVFPASIRHVPPGTRVCAAWSEQLAVDLYPGTVVQTEAKEEIQPNCVPVSFDDGDRRQVPIPNIRILPDHFTNLYELVSVTRDQSGTTRNKLLPSMTDLKFASSSRHSNWDQSMSEVKMTRTNARVRHHSAIDRPSSLISGFIPTKRVARINSRVPTISTPEKVEDERIQTNSISDRKGWSYPRSTGNSTTEQLSPVGDVPLHLACLSLQKHHSPVTSPTLSTIEVCADYTQCMPDIDMQTGCEDPSLSAPNVTSEGPSTDNNPTHSERQNSPSMDHEVLSDTLSTTSSASEQQQIWHILDKVRRRRSRGISCRSIIRQTDGLVISVGDSVEFSSGHDEVYLGEVRAIRWDEVMSAPIVTAAWYYNMNEAGAEGELLMQFKGAVFATEHHDENEARCILRRVHVAPSYAEYQTIIPAAVRVTNSTENCPLHHSIKPDPDACQQTPVDTQDITTDLSNKSDSKPPDSTTVSLSTGSISSGEQTKLPERRQSDNQSSSTSCSTTGDNEEAAYFVAGKYDPVHRRVIAWDPDIARIVHLPV